MDPLEPADTPPPHTDPGASAVTHPNQSKSNRGLGHQKEPPCVDLRSGSGLLSDLLTFPPSGPPAQSPAPPHAPLAHTRRQQQILRGLARLRQVKSPERARPVCRLTDTRLFSGFVTETEGAGDGAEPPPEPPHSTVTPPHATGLHRLGDHRLCNLNIFILTGTFPENHLVVSNVK